MAEETNKQAKAPKQPTGPSKQAGGNDVEDNKLLAVIAYLGILCFVPLLAKKDSEFAQFHAKQGLGLFLVEIAASVIAIVPFIGWLISFLIFMGCLVLGIMGIMNALQGEMKELPLVGSVAEKLNL